jgi:hypothetical protein
MSWTTRSGVEGGRAVCSAQRGRQKMIATMMIRRISPPMLMLMLRPMMRLPRKWRPTNNLDSLPFRSGALRQRTKRPELTLRPFPFPEEAEA